MSNLTKILVATRDEFGLAPWSRLHAYDCERDVEAEIGKKMAKRVAEQCGPYELKELQERIKELECELSSVEEWDGDTQDDIHDALSYFSCIQSILIKKEP